MTRFMEFLHFLWSVVVIGRVMVIAQCSPTENHITDKKAERKAFPEERGSQQSPQPHKAHILLYIMGWDWLGSTFLQGQSAPSFTILYSSLSILLSIISLFSLSLFSQLEFASKGPWTNYGPIRKLN